MVMRLNQFIIVCLCCLFMANTASANVIPEMVEGFQAQGASVGDADAGEALWKKKFMVEGKARSCQSCHTLDLTKAGSHIRTGKIIEPMAPSVTLTRFSEVKKVHKWFRRNCKWVLSRECSIQEKVDILLFLQKQ
ncbi:MAG: DUF1924 domain-containing protein [Mariprofundaceae bacterium]|nr:DUF1924 domain-containing protein [Mariprofundaceae bacterium]